MTDVSFRNMKDKELNDFISYSIKLYAKFIYQHKESSYPKALQASRKEVFSYFPNGKASDRECFIKIIRNSDQQVIGNIWVSIVNNKQRNYSFLQWINIDEAYLRQSFAKQALVLLEEKLKNQGLKQLDLCVFAKNYAARKLYNKLDYKITSSEKYGKAKEATRIRMRKLL